MEGQDGTYQLRNLVPENLAGVGDFSRDFEQLVVETRVTTWTAGRQKSLGGSIAGALGKVLVVVEAIVRITRRCLEIGRAQPGVDELRDLLDTLGEEIV